MKELQKAFNGITIPVEIVNETNMYFTVSEVAKQSGKNITDWKNSKRVKEILIALEKSNGIKGNLIKEDAQGRTQIHNLLFVNFARFVSVEFEIVSNQIIMDILTGEKVLCEKERNGYIKTIEKLKQHQYSKPRAGNFQLVDRIRQDYNINLPTEELNEILEREGILVNKPIMVNNYLPNEDDNRAIRQGRSTLVHEDSVMEIFDNIDGLHRDNGAVDQNPQLPFI